MSMQIWQCTATDSTGKRDRHWIGTARGREDAKRKANKFLHTDPEHYTVNPLTIPGDLVFVEFVVQGREG